VLATIVPSSPNTIPLTPKVLEDFASSLAELILSDTSTAELMVSGKAISDLARGQPNAPDLSTLVTFSEIFNSVVSSGVAGWPAGLQVKVRSTGTLFIVPKNL
jgi:hypothetical protein